MADLSIELCGTSLRNPVVAAAGTCGYVSELADVLAPECLGALVTKSITREPRAGHPPWRLIEVRQGMLNAVGLENVGLDRFLAEKLAGADGIDTVVIGSIAGNSVEDYEAVAAAFDAEDRLPIVELNVSCPNTGNGLVFGEDPGGREAQLLPRRPPGHLRRRVARSDPPAGE